MYSLKIPRALEVIDGREISSGDITHITMVPMIIDGHREELPSFVTKLGHYPLVLGIPWLRFHGVTVSFGSDRISFDSPSCINRCMKEKVVVNTNPQQRVKASDDPSSEAPKLDVSFVGPAAFSRLVKNKRQRHGRLRIFALSLYEINNALNKKKLDEGGIKALVPEEYHEFLPLFSEAAAAQLPPHRKYDHKIPLKEGFEPPFGALYSMSRQELEAVKEWLEENLSKGFIRHSESPAGAPILFVRKADGSLRLCVDYRGLNEGTIKNRYPLPLVQETLARLAKAKYYTALDIRGAYNLVRMAEGEEWKTAFRTRYGLFESLVMPFGLTNAPATFQTFVNDALQPFLDRFVTAYLDDILIYSETLEEHKRHVRQVLEVLSMNGLHLKPEKCHFNQTEVKYLGLIIGQEGIKMDPAKVETVRNWPTPTCTRDIRAFLGFANFYRRFIKGFSQVAKPLTELTGKGIRFSWNDTRQQAFDSLKDAFTSAPILVHFDWDKEIILETDASDYVTAGVLSQRGHDGTLHPVAFYSKKNSPAECNYEIYDKELMAIVRAFEEWRAELESVISPIQVLTDHKNLEYFMSNKLLSRRQARWAEYLSRFNFKIIYQSGKKNTKPDSLTRRSGDLPKEGDEPQNFSTILKPENVMTLDANNATTDPPTLETLFEEAYATDKFPTRVLKMLTDGRRHSREISLAECSDDCGRLRFRNRLYVPESEPLRLRLLQDHHETALAGHPGRGKTLELLQREYYWPKMRQDVDRFVRNCHTCQRSRTSRHAPFGILRPLPIPERPWQDISMDFVVGLPWSEGKDAVWNVVDRLTKQRHFVPCRTDADAKDMVELFIRHILPHHGLPRTITSDRGPQFVATFWKCLCKRLGIDPRQSTAFHPQTDGQTERINAIMEQFLRAHVSYLQDDWVSWLPIAEFATNNHASESLGVSPFFALYGFDPRWQADLSPAARNNVDDQRALSHARKMSEIHDHARAELARAQVRHQDSADTRRLPAPHFQPGDKVYLDAKNIRTQRPSRKLDHRRLGPFEIVEDLRLQTPYAYRLALPESMRIHPVFHVSLLEPAAEDPYPGQQQSPPPPVIVDGEEEWAVDEILDARIRYRKLQYLVKWTGYDRPEWEDARNINGLQAIDQFHTAHPEKPGPLPEDVK